jgi:hypothetical protein
MITRRSRNSANVAVARGAAADAQALGVSYETRHAPLPICVSRSDDETTTPRLRVANTPRERWSTSVFSVSCSRFRGDDAIGVQGETIARFAEQGLSAMGDQSGGHVERSVG